MLSTKQKLKQKLVLVNLESLQQSMTKSLTLLVFASVVGILGRSIFQFVPSVEPLTPLVVLIGFLFGPFTGFIVGASSFYLSNFFVWGFQGPWSLFQSLGAGFAGVVGGIFGIKKSRVSFLLATGVGILIYEVIVNFGGWAIFSLGLIPVEIYFITSLPFSVVHIISSMGFGLFFYELKPKIGGELIEREIFGFRSFASSSNKRDDKILPWFYYRQSKRKSDRS